MKKAIVIGVFLVTALMANAVSVTVFEDDKARHSATHSTGLLRTLDNEIVANGAGNVKLSQSENDDLQPAITKDPTGRIVAVFSSNPSVLEQSVTMVYSDDGSTWTGAVQFEAESGIYQYPSIVGISEAGDMGLTMIEPLAEFPLILYRIGDVTDQETYTGTAYSWGDTEDYNEVTATYVHDLFVPMLTVHNYYISDIPGCPYIAYLLPTLELPTEIGGTYFDGQSILQTAPASNIDMATGQDYFYLLFEHDNQTTGFSEIAFKKTVTDKELLYTEGGGPGGMDQYADIEAMPWQRYLAKGDFNAKDPNVAASGTNVAVVYMDSDNVYGDYDIKCWYSSDSGETWGVSTVAGQGLIDENYPAVFMSGNAVYCVYEKEGNLYLIKSGDGGATWEEPLQVNEVDGTVVSEPRAIDISSGGIVWVDTRDGNQDIYYESLPVPVIEVSISAGFGVSATVANSGTVAGEGLDWSIDLSGFVLVGSHTEGTIDQLNPGAETTISSGLVFGLGPTTITVVAGGSTQTANGFVLGPLVAGV